jgi:hypothetical protein
MHRSIVYFCRIVFPAAAAATQIQIFFPLQFLLVRALQSVQLVADSFAARRDYWLQLIFPSFFSECQVLE